MLKVAVIGSYGHVGTLLDSVHRHVGAEIVAVAPWGDDDPLGYAGKHPAVHAGVPVFEQPEALLEEVDADVVGVFVPLYRLAAISNQAVRGGAHVVSEKPLATTWDDFHTLRESIQENGKSVVALLTTRMSPAFLAARDAVAEGRIGRPIFAFGQKSYPFATRDEYYKTRETYGGSIGWQAVHALDFVSWVAGKEYARVAATLSNQAHPTHPGMEDSGGLILDFVGGGHATIAFDYLRPWPGGPDEKRTWGDDRLRVAGESGVVEVVDEGTRTMLLTPEGTEELQPPPPRDLVGEFIDHLAGRRNDEGLVTTAESLRITEVCLRARDAGDTGQFVELG